MRPSTNFLALSVAALTLFSVAKFAEAQDASTSDSGSSSISSIPSTPASKTSSIAPSSSRSYTVRITSDHAPQLTAVPTTTQTPNETASGATSAATSPASGADKKSSSGSLINYFFVFLAVVVCLFAVLVWLICRRRRRKASRTGTERRRALAQNLGRFDDQIWMERRRWLYGRGWVGGDGANPEAERREEGLDEIGEAPPPYKRSEGDDVPGYERHGAVEIIEEPAPSVRRAEVGLKLPGYEEMFVGPSRAGLGTGELRPESE